MKNTPSVSHSSFLSHTPQKSLKALHRRTNTHQAIIKPFNSMGHSKVLESGQKQTMKIKSCRMLQIQGKFNELLKIREALMAQYLSLMKFYETNEDKLRKIILHQLDHNNSYLYSREVMAFIKFPRYQIVKSINFQLFRHDLLKMTLFLSNFNTKKRIKQVEIIRESMLSRELMIRESSSYEQYDTIYKNMSTPLKNSGYTIYDQYKTIRADFNLPLNSENIHERLFNKIGDVQDCVNSLMKKQTKMKERHKIHILSRQKQDQELT